MRWQFANWFGLGLGLAAVGVGLTSSLYISAEPHAALRVIGEAAGLDAAQARDYRLVVRTVRGKLGLPESGRAQLVAQAQSQIEEAKAIALAARRDVEAAQAKIRALEAQLLAARSAAPRVETAAFTVAGPSGGARACRSAGAPFRCTLRFEPGSAGLDYSDRARLAALVDAVRASGMRTATVEIIGRSDRPGRGEAGPVDCDTPVDSAADLACRRAATVAIELGDRLRNAAGIASALTIEAVVVPTRGPSPSNRRVDILISAS